MNAILMTETQYPEVARIYLEGIATGQSTFQTDAPTWEDWDTNHIQHSRILALDHTTVAGWAALSAVSNRCVYAGVAEVSIYIRESYRGKGVGDFLLKELIQSSESHGIWTLQSGIFPENTASIRLHQKNGFRIVGTREKIGKMNEIWRDVVLLERRSSVTGM